MTLTETHWDSDLRLIEEIRMPYRTRLSFHRSNGTKDKALFPSVTKIIESHTYSALMKLLIKSHPPSVFNTSNQSLRKHSLMGWFPFRLPISFLNCNSRRYLRYRYDVFVSFRGSDLRRGFVDHLYHGLTRAGFCAFLDTHNLNRGDDISESLRNAIEVSHILIPVFSTNYAESAWCLREASFIARQVVLQRQGKGSAITIPLFYDVTPSQVRRPDQCGSPFAEAFEKHESSGRYSTQEINEWKAALFELCRLSGWSLREDTNGYEAALVKRVVEEVAKHCS